LLSVIVLTVILSTVFHNVYADSENVVGNIETAMFIDQADEPLAIRILSHTDYSLSFHSRVLMEHLGYEAEWIESTGQISFTSDENTIIITVGKSTCIKNGIEIEFSRPVFIIDDFSYLPHTFLSEVLSLDIVSVQTAFMRPYRMYAVNVMTYPPNAD